MLVLVIGMILMSCSEKKDDNSLRDLSILGFLSGSSGNSSSSPSNSNQATLQIQGTLKDSSGNPIANATLTLSTSQNILSKTEVTTSTTTDSNGNYTLNLKLGKFSVKVTSSSGVEIGSFSLNATSTTTKPEVAVTSGNVSPVVNTVAVVSPSNEKPSNLTYTSSSIVATVGTAITSLSPTVTGTVTSYTISPSLPSGLSINSTTGVVSGTPTSLELVKSYTITASNSAGSTTFAINISVGGCGKYASSLDLLLNSSTGPSNAPINFTCSFDSTNFKLTCSSAGGFITNVSEYTSKYEFVRELLTIGLTRFKKFSSSQSGGTCITTVTFDSDGRVTLADTVKTGNITICSPGQVTYSNYDSKGRPQTETSASGTTTYVFDDAQRTITASGTGCSSTSTCGTRTFNSDLIETGGGIFSVSNIQTTQICTP